MTDRMTDDRMADNPAQVAPHEFARKGWRFWICRHCYAPPSMHPRQEWVVARPVHANYAIGKTAPHFKEGW